MDQALYGGPVMPALCEDIGYGGAAGGGKTEGGIGIALTAVSQITGVKIGIFRRTFKELEGSDGPIERSYTLFPKIGGKYNESKHLWVFGEDEGAEDWDKGSAAAIRFCHCQHEKDKYDYQSSAFDILIVDEATHFPWSMISYLKTRNRKSRHSQIPIPFALYFSNPGNIGHIWYKQIFGIKDKIYE